MNGISRWPAINVRIDPDVYATLIAKAQERTLPTTVVIREILNAAFKPNEEESR
jgi:hypothetical protein